MQIGLQPARGHCSSGRLVVPGLMADSNSSQERRVVRHTAKGYGRHAAASATTPNCCSASSGQETRSQETRSQGSYEGHRLTRRSLVAAAACLAPWLRAPGQARAEPADLLSWLSWDLSPAPEPVRFPRKPLDQVFAVLLMRSAYDAVDDLDFMPMDAFQRSFWLLRQSEQEGYNLAYSPLKPRLGDLTDPLYFDFISFAQYAAISREIPRGRQLFQEFCDDCPDQTRLVQRNPLNADNATLPAKFDRLVGDKLYDGLLNGFREQQFGAPPPLQRDSSAAVDTQQVVQQVQKLLDVMVGRGYALQAKVTPVQVAEGSNDGQASGAQQFRVAIQGPVNLWGLAALRSRRSLVLNSYAALAIGGYLRASGLQSTYETSFTDTGEQQLWTLEA